MDRRLLGALLLLVTVVAAVVVPNLAVRPIPGSAIGAPVPAPPTVGTCVLDPTDGAFSVDTDGVLSSLTLGTCRGVHYGEVFDVITDGTSLITKLADANFLPDDCGTEYYHYLGLPTPDAHTGATVGDWAVLPGTWTFTGPDLRQRAAGQKWVACAAVSGSADGSFPPGYSGSVRRGLAGGHLPNSFAHCSNSPTTPDAAEVPCAEAHTAEVLGTGTSALWTKSQTELDGSCLDLARSLTRKADVTDGGALTVRASVFGYNEVGIPIPVAAPVTGATESAETIECSISTVGSRKLDGTLISLGSAPIPFA